MAAENGHHVTRAELEAHLKPIREDVSEIRTDVKSLLASQAGQSALSAWHRAVLIPLSVGSVGALATLVWLAHG